MKKKVNRLRQQSGAWILIAFIGLLSAWPSAYSNAQTEKLSAPVTLKAEAILLTTVLQQLQQQTHYIFSYDQPQLSAIRLKQVNWRNTPLGTVLEQLKAQTGVDYTVLGKNIAVALVRASSSSGKEQPGKLTGKITDAANGEILIGSGIRVGSKGAASNEQGIYTLELPEGTYIAEASFIGYKNNRIAPVTIKAGTTTRLDIALQRQEGKLQEVVVTALGIKKDEKSLGYAIQKVDGDEVSSAPTNNWINALSGKVAGLTLNKVGGPLGSSDVVLRGDNVLALGGSTALIVVDGVPISTAQSGTGNGPLVDADSPVDFGSSLSDLNPEEIESITVLKGPGATALYGSRASNGAIVITTKSNNKTKGWGVYANTVQEISQVNRWPDYQYEYGAGGGGARYYSYGNTVDGNSLQTATAAWGARFAGQSYFQYNSPIDPVTGQRTERVPWVPYENAYKGIFRNGFTSTNTIGVAGPNMRAGITYLKNNWITPNSGFSRVSAWLSGNQKISNKVTISGKLNYNRKFSDNLPAQGYNNQTIMYYVNQTAPNNNVEWNKPMWLPNQEQVAQQSPFWPGMDNPYLISYEMLNGTDKHDVIGNINAVVQLTPRLSLSLRSGMDLNYEFRTQQRPMSTYKFKQGMYRQQSVFRIENNSDFLLKYDNKLPGGIKYTASFGGNQRFNDYKYTDNRADNLVIPGVYNLGNSRDPVVTIPDRASFLVNSLYGFLNLNFREKVFLELTGRNDWSSTLPKQNQSFFYPSINASVLLDKLVKLPQFVSQAKFRASYASTGVDARTAYTFLENYSSTSFPGSLTSPGTLPNKNLKPQLTNAIEAGGDFRFLNSRLGIDWSVYRNVTNNQILSLPIDGASGYSNAMVNIGKVQNKGVEIMLTGIPYYNLDFRWNVTLNWAANRSKALELTTSPGSEGMLILYNVSWASIQVVAQEGKSFPQLYGLGLKRTPDGQVIYDNSGLPLLTDTLQNRGSISPDWQGGIKNELSYKGLRFSFLVDIRQGGKMMSYSHAIMAANGKLRETLPGRETGIVGPGVVQKADGTYVPNTTNVSAATYYSRYFNYTNMEANVFSTSFVKLREVTLNYDLPKKWLKGTFIKQLAVGVYGRDLFNWTKFPMYDPETATMNGSQIMAGIEIGQFPSTRAIGANLKLDF